MFEYPRHSTRAARRACFAQPRVARLSFATELRGDTDLNPPVRGGHNPSGRARDHSRSERSALNSKNRMLYYLPRAPHAFGGACTLLSNH